MWASVKIIAARIFDNLFRKNGANFFKKSPLYSNSSINPFASTKIKAQGAKERTICGSMFSALAIRTDNADSYIKPHRRFFHIRKHFMIYHRLQVTSSFSTVQIN